MSVKDFDSILTHLNCAVIVVNEQGETEYVNPSAQALLALSTGHQTGSYLTSLPTMAKQTLGDWVQQAFETRVPVTYREVTIGIPEQSKLITVHCTLSVIDTGVPYVVIELVSLDRILRIAKDEQLLMQQKANREMVRGMAHEIKNPLGAIRGAAQLLAMDIDSEQQQYTHIVISEVDRLQALINRMLGTYSPLKRELHNIHEITQHVSKIVQLEAQGKANFVRDYDPSLPEIKVDRDQLIQAILNIVQNAWQAVGSQGQITLKTRAIRNFTVGQKMHKLVLALHIMDDGEGIPDALKEHIFYPMVTGRSEGTGLGLSIAQDIVSKHGGVIECESRTGQTVFSLYLPYD